MTPAAVDVVPASARLSVMIRSFRGDIIFAREAILSAARHVANALEIVVVVPKVGVKICISENKHIHLVCFVVGAL